jgi:hypothetical protein
MNTIKGQGAGGIKGLLFRLTKRIWVREIDLSLSHVQCVNNIPSSSKRLYPNPDAKIISDVIACSTAIINSTSVPAFFFFLTTGLWCTWVCYFDARNQFSFK